MKKDDCVRHPYALNVMLLVGCVVFLTSATLPELLQSRQSLSPATTTPDYQSMLKVTEAAFSSYLPENIIISPDQQHIIGIENTMVGVWSADTREFLGLLREAYSPPGNTSFEISPDGRYLWNAGLYFYLWDVGELETVLMIPYTIAHLRSRHFVSQNARYFAFWQCDSSGSSHGICSSMSLSVFDMEKHEWVVQAEENFGLHFGAVEFNEDQHIITATGCQHFQVLSDMVYGRCEEPGEITWPLQTDARLDVQP